MKIRKCLSVTYRVRLRLAALGACALLVQGCATVPSGPLPPPLPPAERELVLAKLQSWSAEGRAAVQVGNDGNSVGFQWQRDNGAEVLRMTDPLGRTVLLLSQDAQGAYAKFADGYEVRGSDMAALLAQRSPLPLPLEGLSYWLRGQPEPGQPAAVTHDAEGRPATLRQGDWEVRYQDYTPVEGVYMPARLLVSGPNQVTVKVLVRRWDLRFAAPLPTAAARPNG